MYENGGLSATDAMLLATPATTPAPAVNVQNANLTVTRIA